MFQKTTLYIGSEISNILFEDGKSYLLIIAQHSKLSHYAINHSSDIYAVIFPAVIYGNKLYDNGVLVCELAKETVIMHSGYKNESYNEVLTKSRSVLLFVYWLNPSIYESLDRIFSYTSEDVSIMGAGCGRTSRDYNGIITKNGLDLHEDVLVLTSSQKLSIGVKHSVAFHNGYYIARTEYGNKITTINGTNAAPFYINMIKKYFDEDVTPENIFSIGVKYPIGLGATRGEHPIRVPVAIEGESIIVGGPMDREHTISLMCANSKTLLEASSLAMMEVKKEVGDVAQKECFIIEGAGRQISLGERFSEELESIASNFLHPTQCYGILSLGEIANSSDKYIEYSNEACVIGVFNATK